MLWVERLTLSNFRNYTHAALEAGPEPQVLIGANGAGKTNLLEAVSLLAPGQGMRRAAYPDLARGTGDGGWAVAAHTHTHMGPIDIGTGLAGRDRGRQSAPAGVVRINGETAAGAGALADYVEVVWVTPAMDGLFTGPGVRAAPFSRPADPVLRPRLSHRRRRASSAPCSSATGCSPTACATTARFEGLELLMAETGVAIAAARAEAVAALAAIMAERTARDPTSPFPAAGLALEGALEADLERLPAVEVEDSYAQRLRDGPRARPRGGAHARWPAPLRSARRACAEGHAGAAVLDGRAEGAADRPRSSPTPSSSPAAARARPILLLDEVTAHLDAERRAALFAEILRLGAQAWMTGTDAQAFSWLAGKARFWRVEDGLLSTFDGQPEHGAAAPSN